MYYVIYEDKKKNLDIRLAKDYLCLRTLKKTKYF